MTKARENSDYTGLQGDLALKSPVASPVFTGNVGVTGTNAAVNVICGGVTEDSNLNFVQGSTTEGGITYDHNSGYASEQMNFRVGNNTTHMSINGAGIVTKPNQPCFRAGLSTSTSTSTNSIIVFNTVASSNFGFNQGNHFSTSTGRFTAPVAGVYCFSSGVLFEGVATNTDMAESLYLYRNGAHNAYSVRRANYVSNVTGNAGYYGDYLHSELDLAAGDYITIISRHAETTHGNAKYTFFQGHLIG